MRAFATLLVLLTAAASAQTPGSCEIGQATGTLDASAVRASFPITGTLFFGPDLAADYVVPQALGVSPVYAASVWVGGTVDGEVRVAGSTYGQGGRNNDYYEFWPGPLDDGATLPDPADCSAWDRIWVVSAADVAAYEAGQTSSPDLAEWPVGLGAPAVDANGTPVEAASRDQRIDLAAGQRPVLFGSQAAFWVMNDVGNEHRATKSKPLGIEVAVTAFSVVSEVPALNESTFYRYRITNRSVAPIEDTRVGFWADVDLGNAADDFVGSDTTRSMGYVYNADGIDDGAYGSAPPAVGFDVLGGQAQITPTLTSFLYYVGGDANRGDPVNALEYYRTMQGLWRDGTSITAFGNGYNTAGDITKFAYPGDPVARAFWSEENNGNGQSVPGERRFVLNAALGTLAAGASATVDYALIYAHGGDRLDSITELRAASDDIQARYDAGTLFAPAPPPSGPVPGTPTLLSPADGAGPLAGPVELVWTASPNAIDYLVEISETATFEDAERRVVREARTTYTTRTTSSFVESTATVYWRVTARRGALTSLRTSARSYAVSVPATAPEVFVVEIQGPGGADPCAATAESRTGCPPPGSPLLQTSPGNLVYGSLNGTGSYSMFFSGPSDQLALISDYAPNDYEIRVVPESEGSYASYQFTTGRIIRVPFQVWDVGSTTPGQANDPDDDVRMIPILLSDEGRGEASECTFGFTGPRILGDGTEGHTTQRIYAYYPVDDDYSAFEALAAAAVDATSTGCPARPATEPATARIDYGRDRPLNRNVFVQAGSTTTMADLEGAIIRYYTREGSTPTEPEAVTASGLSLSAPAPNPVSGRGRLTVRTASAGLLRVTLVDLLGRRVAVLTEGPRPPGEHPVSLDASPLAAGVYVVVAESEDARVSRLITVAR